MAPVRTFALFCLVAMPLLAYGSSAEQTMHGKSHRDVLRMGLEAWQDLDSKKSDSMEKHFEASSFYLVAAQELNQQILAKKPKSERERWSKLRLALKGLASDMFEAVQLAIGGGSAYGWGMSCNRTYIASEELLYKLVTGKKYHENPISFSGSQTTFDAWKIKIRDGIGDDSKTSRDLLIRIEDKMNHAIEVAETIGTKQKHEVQGLISNLCGYWKSKL